MPHHLCMSTRRALVSQPLDPCAMIVGQKRLRRLFSSDGVSCQRCTSARDFTLQCYLPRWIETTRTKQARALIQHHVCLLPTALASGTRRCSRLGLCSNVGTQAYSCDRLPDDGDLRVMANALGNEATMSNRGSGMPFELLWQSPWGPRLEPQRPRLRCRRRVPKPMLPPRPRRPCGRLRRSFKRDGDLLANRQRPARLTEAPFRICIEVDGLQLALTQLDHGAEGS